MRFCAIVSKVEVCDDWVHWYNHERLHSKNGYLSPIDAENIYYCSLKPLGYAVMYAEKNGKKYLVN
ncbi:integrase core domain-containing protein [Moraxella atlantae]|uniref:integrase core domain-containing protein n=1 Tax=Faucicola atlantae TaxID=34059 RepID=UPI0037525E5B